MMPTPASETPGPGEMTPGSTLLDELRDRVTNDSDRIAMLRKRHGIWEATTWSELGGRVAMLAGGLREHGLEAGGTVAIIGDPTPEWLALDLAAQSLGAVSVALFPNQCRDDIRTLLGDGTIDVLAGGDDEQLGRARDALPAVRTSLLLAERFIGRRGDSKVETIGELIGNSALPTTVSDPGRTAVGLISAGTSGSPRLVPLGHAELLAAARRAAGWLGLTRSDHNLCHVPCALPAARLLDLYAPICAGSVIAFPESPQTIVENLVELQPTVLTTTPRALELLAADVELHVGRSGRVKSAANRWAQRSRERATAHRPAGAGLPRPTLSHFLVDRQVVSQLGLRRARRVTSAGGPVTPELVSFFWALRVPVVEAYGQPETCGLAFAQRGPQDSGTVGPALDGVQSRIEDGTLRLRIASGGGEQWFDTDDVASLDGDGRLVLVGGRGEVATGLGGVQIVLARIEGRLRLNPLINEAVAVPAVSGGVHALIQFDADAVNARRSREGQAVLSFEVLAGDPDVVALIASAVDSANQGLADGERITAFRLVQRPLSLERGEISPNHRVRRGVVSGSFAGPLAAMN